MLEDKKKLIGKKYGRLTSHIHRVAKGQRVHTHGYVWKYESDYLEVN